MYLGLVLSCARSCLGSFLSTLLYEDFGYCCCFRGHRCLSRASGSVDQCCWWRLECLIVVSVWMLFENAWVDFVVVIEWFLV